jgi:hypothetical protein
MMYFGSGNGFGSVRGLVSSLGLRLRLDSGLVEGGVLLVWCRLCLVCGLGGVDVGVGDGVLWLGRSGCFDVERWCIAFGSALRWCRGFCYWCGVYCADDGGRISSRSDLRCWLIVGMMVEFSVRSPFSFGTCGICLNCYVEIGRLVSRLLSCCYSCRMPLLGLRDHSF